jgi:hypothetical protein
MKAGKRFVSICLNISEFVAGFHRLLSHSVEADLFHDLSKLSYRGIPLQIRLDSLGKVDCERLAMANDPLGIRDGTNLSVSFEYSVSLLKIADWFFDVMNHIH